MGRRAHGVSVVEWIALLAVVVAAGLGVARVVQGDLGRAGHCVVLADGSCRGDGDGPRNGDGPRSGDGANAGGGLSANELLGARSPSTPPSARASAIATPSPSQGERYVNVLVVPERPTESFDVHVTDAAGHPVAQFAPPLLQTSTWMPSRYRLIVTGVPARATK